MNMARRTTHPIQNPKSKIQNGSSGSLLIVVLWIVTVLGVLAAAMGGYLRTEIHLARYQLARAHAKAWAKAGIYRALYKLADDFKVPEYTDLSSGNTYDYDWLQDDWAIPWTETFSFGGSGGTVEMTVTDEERRLNVNQLVERAISGDVLDDEMYAAFDQLLNNTPAVNAILDYLDQDQCAGGIGACVSPSEGQSTYRAKNDDIVALEELREIPAITTGLYENILQDFASAVPSGNMVNINTAPQPVLEALITAVDPSHSACPSGLADDLVNLRPTEWFIELVPAPQTSSGSGPTDLDTCLTAGLGTLVDVESSFFRIVAKAQITSVTPAVEYQIEAIVERDGADTPLMRVGGIDFHILGWRES